MSASSIPNLLSSAGGRGSRLNRLRGRGRGQQSESSSRQDAAIQRTDTDAAVSRLSAVDVGYLDDPHAAYFVSTVNGPPTRRLPIINRGTYTRTRALDRLIEGFLTQDPESTLSSAPRQIISLGAGTDTRPFRTFTSSRCRNLIYHEIDFPATASKKLQTVRSTPSLFRIFPNLNESEGGSWSSVHAGGSVYHCHAVDLRDLGRTVLSALSGMDSNAPTLLLSECCLCYMEEEDSKRVLEYFTSRIDNLVVVLYEPIHLDDAFGRTMVFNLAARNISMPGLEQYRNSDDQVRRLRQAGYETVRFNTVDKIWDAWIDQDEKERLDSLEGLDEVEEWKLLAGHYIIVWGYKGKGFGVLEHLT